MAQEETLDRQSSLPLPSLVSDKACWQGVRGLEGVLACETLIVFVGQRLPQSLIPLPVPLLQFFSSIMHITWCQDWVTAGVLQEMWPWMPVILLSIVGQISYKLEELYEQKAMNKSFANLCIWSALNDLHWEWPLSLLGP